MFYLLHILLVNELSKYNQRAWDLILILRRFVTVISHAEFTVGTLTERRVTQTEVAFKYKRKGHGNEST